jgi:hypothetical protein
MVADRPRACRAWRLALILLAGAAGLIGLAPAAATARPPDAADRQNTRHLDGPYAMGSSQHGIQDREPVPPVVERRVARGVDLQGPPTYRADQSHPTPRTRLAYRMQPGPPTRTAGGSSSRAPPPAARTIRPLA